MNNKLLNDFLTYGVICVQNIIHLFSAHKNCVLNPCITKDKYVYKCKK